MTTAFRSLLLLDCRATYASRNCRSASNQFSWSRPSACPSESQSSYALSAIAAWVGAALSGFDGLGKETLAIATGLAFMAFGTREVGAPVCFVLIVILLFFLDLFSFSLGRGCGSGWQGRE